MRLAGHLGRHRRFRAGDWHAAVDDLSAGVSGRCSRPDLGARRNRSVPAGYKLIRIPFAEGVAGQAEDFATGWMANEGDRGSVWGRPVDVLVAPDGALLVSDDNAGAVYRITYTAG